MSTMGYVTTLSSADDAATVKFDFANQDYRVSGQSKQFSDAINFTRNTTGGRWNEKGFYETVAINQPRFDYNPITKVARGILLEPQRSNIALNSDQPIAQATRGTAITDGELWIDGVSQFQKFVEDTSNNTHFFLPTTSTFEAKTTYCISYFVKAAGRSAFNFTLQNTANWNNAWIAVNLTTGKVTPANGAVGYLEDYGNGVYRVSLVATTTATSSFASTGYISLLDGSGSNTYQGDGVSGIYVGGYQVEASAFPTSYIPTSKTFQSRTTPATWINSKGAVSTVAANVARVNTYDWFGGVLKPVGALNEAAATNLVRSSGDLSITSLWSKVSTGLTISAGSAAPDNSLSNRLNLIGTTNHNINQSLTAALVVGSTYTMSLWLKAVKGSQSFQLGYYDLSTSLNATTVNPTSEWARYSYTFTVTTAATSPQIRLVGFGNGLDGDQFDVWGVQLELGAQASSYVATPVTFISRSTIATYIDATGTVQTAGVNVARNNAYSFDNNGKLIKIPILIEESRTNYAKDSGFSRTLMGWYRSPGIVEGDLGLAPDGTVSATSVSSTAGVSSFLSQVSGVPAGTNTFSLFCKPKDQNTPFSLFFEFGSGTGGTVQFDVVSKVFSGAASGWTGSYVDVGNGWTRVSITCISQKLAFYLNTYGPASATTHSGYIWGFQAEGGANSTSLIPTTTVATTRAADVFTANTVTRAADVTTSSASTRGNESVNSAIVSGGWFNQNEGTFTVTARHINGSYASNKHILGIQGPTITDWLAIRTTVSLVQVGSANTSGSATTTMGGFNVPDGNEFNAALKYKLNDSAFSVNGASVQTDISCTWPAVVPYNKMLIGNYASGDSSVSGWIKKITYFNKALPNTQTQIISS